MFGFVIIKTCFMAILCLGNTNIYITYNNQPDISITEEAYPSEEEEKATATIEEEKYRDEFEEMDLVLRTKNEVTYTRIFNAVKSGDIKAIGKCITDMIYNSMLYELSEGRRLFVQLTAIVMLGTIFTNLSGRIGGYAGGNGFFVTYMVMTALLLSCFTLASDIAIDVISGINEFMMAFIPAYSMAAAYSNGQETARFSKEIILLVIFVCENILLKIIFPIIKCSGICGLVNKMNTEDYFSKLTDLLKSISNWLIKSIFAAITGINIIKGIISPSIDKTVRSSTIKLISNMGGATVRTVAGVLVSSGMLIKNSIGIAGAVIIIVIAVIPAVKIFILFMGLKAIAALVQPMGDKRFSESVSSMAEAIELLFKTTGTAVLMFIISISALIVFSR